MSGTMEEEKKKVGEKNKCLRITSFTLTFFFFFKIHFSFKIVNSPLKLEFEILFHIL